MNTRCIVVAEINILAVSKRCRILKYLAIRGYHFESTVTPMRPSLGSTLTLV